MITKRTNSGVQNTVTVDSRPKSRSILKCTRRDCYRVESFVSHSQREREREEEGTEGIKISEPDLNILFHHFSTLSVFERSQSIMCMIRVNCSIRYDSHLRILKIYQLSNLVMKEYPVLLKQWTSDKLCSSKRSSEVWSVDACVHSFSN